MSKILIVDDTSTNRELLKEVFCGEEDAHIIVEADSGPAALSAVDKDCPDIILLDVMMPGMDGFEVCKKLKAAEKYQMIPILFITAMEKTEDMVRGFELGAADYITKPINPTEVRSRVNAHLKIKEAEENRLLAESLRTVKDMIVTYNHTINQPLTTIYSYLAVLLERINENDKNHQTLQKIKKELDAINFILKKIKEIDKVKRTDYVGDTGMIDLN